MSSWHRVHYLLAAVAVLLCAACAATADRETPTARKPPSWVDLRRQPPISGDIQAGKAHSQVCAACHGKNGLSVSPEHPNLAAQSATYLYVQLEAFKGGQRQSQIMSGMVTDLSDTEMRNLAAYYASLPPPPDEATDATSLGARLYHHGDPARGIPPCQGCHGPAGRGPRTYPDGAPHPPWSTFPMLRGQPTKYLVEELHAFKSGKRNGTSDASIMHGVAQRLTDADIKALATYIETL